MTAPVVRVEIGFQQTLAFSQPFQLNSAVYGLLDTGTLGGIEMVDVTEYVQTINIQRGRNRQLDQFNAGTATVSLWNQQRIFDPLNADSPFFGVIIPRSPINIYANEIPIYSGVVSDWDVDYEIPNTDIVYLNCSDVFTVLANQSMNEQTTTTQSSSARVEAVLTLGEVAYQGPTQIGTGSSTLGGTALNAGFTISQDTTVLNYLQTITKSEQGYLYIAVDGTLVFKGRTEVLNPVIGADFTDDGTGIPYQTIVNQFGDELLYNYVRTESPAGAAQIASDAGSIALYQSQVLNETNLLNSTTTEVLGLAQYLLGKFKDPVLRFTGVSTELTALDNSHQNTCLMLDLTDIVTVAKSFAVGNPSTVTQTVIVSGVNHTIRPGSHVITYTFESTDGNQYLTLNAAIFGILDQNLLSF
jgi:hypothetical protein